MSDIPRARELLKLAYRESHQPRVRHLIRKALNRMKRERPKFIVERDVKKPLSKVQRVIARRLRNNHHMSMRRIAVRLRTNQGRISEAINPERQKLRSRSSS